jgi:hypothetical protein
MPVGVSRRHQHQKALKRSLQLCTKNDGIFDRGASHQPLSRPLPHALNPAV